MPRFALQIESERHGFVNMLADRMTELQPERFVASRVRHPLSTFGEVILDAEREAEARDAIAATCDELVAECDLLLRSLGMSDVAPPLFAHVSALKTTLVRTSE